VVDLVDHKKLQMKLDVFAQGMAEEMLTMQFLVSILHSVFFPFRVHFSSNAVFSQLQGFLRSTILYCYFQKVSASDDGAEDLKKKLAEAEAEKKTWIDSVYMEYFVIAQSHNHCHGGLLHCIFT
jgi:hypothetical protein